MASWKEFLILDSGATTLKNFFEDFIYLFSERGEGRAKEGEKHQLVASAHIPTRNQTSNPGMCPRLGIEPVTFSFAG